MPNFPKLGDEALNNMGVEDAKVTPKKDLQDYIQSHLFDINKKPDPAAFVLYHDGVPIVSRGNLFSISGPAKSRKSVIVSAMMACMMNEKSALGFSSKLDNKDLIIHMDTEQAYLHYYNTVKRTIEMSGLQNVPNHYKSIRTRDAGSSEMRVMILEELFALYKPTIFILDGVTDLLDDINSNEESSELGNRLLRLSDQYNAAIGLVIHETKSTNKLRGAIGTTITNKVECSISVELDEKNPIASHVRCKDSRNKPFEPFTIVQDGINGEVRLAEDSEVEAMTKTTKGNNKTFDAAKRPDDEHFEMLQVMRNHSERYSNDKEAAEIVKNFSLKRYGQSLKITEAKQCIAYFVRKGWMIRNMENTLIIVGLSEEDIEDLPF